VENSIFGRDVLDMALEARGWRLASTLCTPDMPRLSEPRLAAWARACVQRHPQRELILVLKGRGFYALAGRVYAARPGDVFFMDSEEPHGYPYPSFCPDCDHFLVQITRKAVLCRSYSVRGGKEQPLQPTHPLQGSAVAMGVLEESLALLRANPELPTAFRRFTLLTAIRFLIAQIAAQGFLSGGGRPPRAEFRRQMVATVREHIKDTAGKGVSLTGLSLLTGYSRHHLLRIFEAATGQTIHGYIESVRVLRVKELLSRGMSKKEAAAELGFSCPAAFSRWLAARCPSLVGRRMVGGSPGAAPAARG
jgi:AraC-like DNA-binding protein